MSWSGTVTCSYCYTRGHNRRKCPELTAKHERSYKMQMERAAEYRAMDPAAAEAQGTDIQWNIDYHERKAEQHRQEYMKRTKIDLATGQKVTNKAAKAERMKKVTCGYCGKRGHTRRVCQNAKNDYAIYVERTRQVRQDWYERFKASGMGIGSMVVGIASGYDSLGQWGRHKVTALVTDIQWDRIDAHHPDSRVLRVKSNSALKGVRGGTSLSDVSLLELDRIADPSTRAELQAAIPSGAIPPMPEGYLTDVKPIKEVFDTSNERPWDYRGYDSDDWRGRVREQLGLPTCAYSS